jgi:hypothetical protein
MHSTDDLLLTIWTLPSIPNKRGHYIGQLLMMVDNLDHHKRKGLGPRAKSSLPGRGEGCYMVLAAFTALDEIFGCKVAQLGLN